MSTGTYRVIFCGEIAADADPKQVKIGMAKLFRLDPAQPEHLTKLKRMFSGRTIVIKDNLAMADAEKYRSAIEQVGGISHIELTPAEERRKEQRRKIPDRREVRRSSAILPDRRKNSGRRSTDSD